MINVLNFVVEGNLLCLLLQKRSSMLKRLPKMFVGETQSRFYDHIFFLEKNLLPKVLSTMLILHSYSNIKQ